MNEMFLKDLAAAEELWRIYADMKFGLDEGALARVEARGAFLDGVLHERGWRLVMSQGIPCYVTVGSQLVH